MSRQDGSSPEQSTMVAAARIAREDDDGRGGGARLTALVVERPGQPPATIALEGQHLTFGRRDAAHVVFDLPEISRLHGALVGDDEGWWYEDCGSSNGSVLHSADGRVVIVNAHRRVRVRPDDAVALGGTAARLRFVGSGNTRPVAAGIVSDAGRRLEADLAMAARTRVPVFLLGPSGAGKTRSARTIHELSGLKGPLVVVNCARLPQDPTALHSDLLGHQKGAYTGADSARVGRLFAADGGTLFLDEVESMPTVAQGFLLDVLEGSGDAAPLGASPTSPRKAPVFRLVSASKAPLAHSGLRADLSERLAEGLMFRLPTLDERREDIPGLVRGFLQEQSALLGLEVMADDDAIALAATARWPGQIRQLRATITTLAQSLQARADVHARRLTILRDDLEHHLRARADAFGAGTDPVGAVNGAGTTAPVTPATVAVPGVPGLAVVDARSLKKEHIVAALEHRNGNQSAAARDLQIARNTLIKKMKQFGLLGEDDPT